VLSQCCWAARSSSAGAYFSCMGMGSVLAERIVDQTANYSGCTLC